MSNNFLSVDVIEDAVKIVLDAGIDLLHGEPVVCHPLPVPVSQGLILVGSKCGIS